MTGETFIKAGFASQFVLLFLVDWATLKGFARGGVPWYHHVGFFVVNAVLVGTSVIVWRWLWTRRRTPDAQ